MSRSFFEVNDIYMDYIFIKEKREVVGNCGLNKSMEYKNPFWNDKNTQKRNEISNYLFWVLSSLFLIISLLCQKISANAFFDTIFANIEI